LIDGTSRTHRYELPEDDTEADNLIDEIFFIIKLIYQKDNLRRLFFENPYIFYNPENVTCVEISGEGKKDIKNSIERQSRKMGFIDKDKK